MKFLEKALAPIRGQIRNMVARGVLTLINDAAKMQEVQASLLADEVQDRLERIQNYGQTAIPPVGSECAVIFLGGNREHGLVLAAEDRDVRRAAIDNVAAETGLVLGAGDVLLYSSGGNFIVIRAGGNIILGSPETLRIQANAIELHATERIKWDVSGRGYDYFPTHTDTWETGSVAGTPHPITPQEHPPTPAQ